MGLVKYSFALIIMLNLSCGYVNKHLKATPKHYTRYYNCLRKEQLLKFKSNSTYNEIYKDFTLILNNWIYKEKDYYFKNYPNYYDYRVDSCIFISSDTSSALLLITLVEKTYRSQGFGGDCRLIFAQRLKTKWNYYHQALPSFTFGLDTARQNKRILYTHAEIAQKTINLLMQDGLIKFRKPCISDDKYIKTKWDLPWIKKK